LKSELTSFEVSTLQNDAHALGARLEIAVVVDGLRSFLWLSRCGQMKNVPQASF
jgi:hypothetical protein